MPEPTRRPQPAPAPPPAPAQDWPVQVADTIESVVGSVRDKTAGPAITAARGVVYGLAAAIIGISAGILLLVALLRAVNNGLNGIFGHDQHMWAAYLLVGVPLLLVGLWAWGRRTP